MLRLFFRLRVLALIVTGFALATSESVAAPQTNSPPNPPASPTPSNNTVEVFIQNGQCTLFWQGGDADNDVAGRPVRVLVKQC